MKMESQLNQLRTELTYTQALLTKTEENRELLARIVEASRSPQNLLKPWQIPAQKRPYQSELSVLHADLENFSGAVKGEDALRTTLQSFLAEFHAEFQSQPACERIKNQGDGFLIFSTDSLWLFEVAHEFGNRFNQFKLRNPSLLGCLRSVLNRGRVNCIAVSGSNEKDFDGDAIIECKRIDQPMKAYLREHKIFGNQMWCTEAFKADVESRSPHLQFVLLPAMQLDKNYESRSKLFQITVA